MRTRISRFFRIRVGFSARWMFGFVNRKAAILTQEGVATRAFSWQTELIALTAVYNSLMDSLRFWISWFGGDGEEFTERRRLVYSKATSFYGISSSCPLYWWGVSIRLLAIVTIALTKCCCVVSDAFWSAGSNSTSIMLNITVVNRERVFGGANI